DERSGKFVIGDELFSDSLFDLPIILNHTNLMKTM
ncbi:hypothetical protein Tco_0993181, partial [Tanacetum coccineum]